jgi:hypothetical protein
LTVINEKEVGGGAQARWEGAGHGWHSHRHPQDGS